MENEDQRNRLRKKRKMDLLLLIIILVGAMIYYRFNSADQITLQAREASLEIMGPDQFFIEIPYEKMDTLELRDCPEDLQNGKESRYCRYGNWEISDGTVYTVGLVKNLHKCIYVSAKGEEFLINTESDEVTERFFEAFQKLQKEVK